MRVHLRPVVAVSFLFCGTMILIASATAAVDRTPPRIRISILVDDKHVLDGNSDYSDEEAQLKRIGLTPVKEGAVAPDPDTQLKATLRGKVVARVSVVAHAASPGRDSESKELRLVRDQAGEPWRLHADDAARIEKDTDIKKTFEEAVAIEEKRYKSATTAPAQPAAPPAETNYWPWIIGGGIALLAVLALVLVVTMRGKTNTPA